MVPSRLYFGSQRLWRSDDRGDSWRPISPDLTRALDRNKLEVMGRVWSVDAVAKNASTSFYGNVVAFSESPLDENVLYAGTDDGLVQVTMDAGGTVIESGRGAGVGSPVFSSTLAGSAIESLYIGMPSITTVSGKSGDDAGSRDISTVATPDGGGSSSASATPVSSGAAGPLWHVMHAELDGVPLIARWHPEHSRACAVCVWQPTQLRFAP